MSIFNQLQRAVKPSYNCKTTKTIYKKNIVAKLLSMPTRFWDSSGSANSRIIINLIIIHCSHHLSSHWLTAYS